MSTRGSEWRMWDLHVHTPDSLINNYRGPDPWKQYLSDLRSLPSEIKVVGINDYWFLDGYKRVKAAFDAGQLPNLDAVFPVLEVRCDTFGGVDGRLRKINLHFICDPELPADELSEQLIPALKKRFVLGTGQEEEWNEVVTKNSLRRLGRRIRETAPADRRAEYSNDDLVVGFNNMCVNFDAAVDHVRNHTLLSQHVLIGIGKTEWAAIRWTDQSIASKRHIFARSDLVFTAAASRDEYKQAAESLRAAGMSAKLLDCSDAHHNLDSDQKDRLGNVFTWINADPTFRGLKHALREFEHRVTTARRPPVLERVAQRPASVMETIKITRSTLESESTLGPGYFDVEIPLNPAFTVILGNKGQGKSALLDSIAAAANSDRDNDYSFLSPARFRRQNGRVARQYVAEVTWADSHTSSAQLHQRHQPDRPVEVDYLPQSLIEKVCSSDPESVEGRHFEAEIARVVFRHLPDSQRRDFTSLQQYVDSKSRSAQTALAAARGKIAQASRRLVALEDRAIQLAEMGLQARYETLTKALSDVEDELRAANERLEDARSEQTNGLAAELAASLQMRVAERDQLRRELDSTRQIMADEESRLSSAEHEYQALLEAVASAQALAASVGRLTGIQPEHLLRVSLGTESWNIWLQGQRAKAEEVRSKLEDPESGVLVRISRKDEEIASLQTQLSEVDRQLSELTSAVADLDRRRLEMLGDPTKSGTLAGLRALLSEQQGIPTQLAEARESLKANFVEAHEALMEIHKVHREAYEAAANFVESNELVSTVGLEFGVELGVSNFIASWISLVNRQKLTQMGDAFENLDDRALIGETTLDDAGSLYAKLFDIEKRLRTERGAADGSTRPLSDVMRQHSSADALLTALYSMNWLESRYVIRSGGVDLSQLSPGQRGLVLLMFYLLVDKSERPLLLDQPEENLDNQTVKAFLVPALRDAISRRQVIAVTHSPNLAIVGDADQIILAEKQYESFTYRTGSLASFDIGRQSVDVLEGTRAAFDNRRSKYEDVVGI